jgi:hypothetical protein
MQAAHPELRLPLVVIVKLTNGALQGGFFQSIFFNLKTVFGQE